MPQLTRGIVAERHYVDGEWKQLPPQKIHEMTACATRSAHAAFRQLQHQRSARPAPWIARNIFGCALITWTVRTPEQQAKTYRYADQMTFEGFIPE
jgi:glycerophosphoryl diester phosphodiesterase